MERALNYFITCPTRSGSSFLGEALQNHGLPYFNELFTPEICRRRGLWPRRVDDKLGSHVIDLVSGEANAGFKMPYTEDHPEVLAEIQRRHYFKVIHIIRDDVLEQLASWAYLNQCGVSMARADGTLWNTDGQQIDMPQHQELVITPEEAQQHFEFIDRMRWVSWWMFSQSHEYMEIHMEDLFRNDGLRRICSFMGVRFRSANVPNHIKTPRPAARDLIANFEDLKQHFCRSKWGNWFAGE